MTSILSYADSQKQWNNENDIAHVIDDLNNNKTIETLQFTGNTLGVIAAEKLTIPLSHQSNLKKLLWNDLFTGRLKSEIGIALKSLSMGLMRAQVNLVELDLSDNAFGPNGVVGVTDLLASPCCYTLKTLNMNNQGLGHQGCRHLIDALKTARTNSNKQGMNLEVFIAGRNRLENAGMRMLTEFFGDGMSSLKKIVLLQNGIGIHGIEGVEDLIFSIRNHTNLKILNISDNTIKPDGMKLFCDILPYFENLEEIHMEDCLLGSAGLSRFTGILDDLSSDLKTISVAGNEIKGRAAKNFVSMLVRKKPHVEKVNLTENEIKASYKNEIRDIMDEYDMGHVLVNEEQISEEDDADEETDEETDSGEETDDSRGSRDSESSGSSQEESDHSEDDNEAAHNPNPFTTAKNIFSSDKSSASPFVFTRNNGPADSGKNLFSSPSSAGANLFKPQTAAATNSIFSTKDSAASPDLFKFQAPTSNLFKPQTPASGTGLFSSSSSGSPSNLFKSGTNAAPNLFATKPTNIFQSSSTNPTNPPSRPFSFVNAAANAPITAATVATGNDNSDAVRQFIVANLELESVMRVGKPAMLTGPAAAVVDKGLLDGDMRARAGGHPENAVRIGLVLCSQSATFELGVALIDCVLTSPTVWSRATNAVLVEMGCIKGEEKGFVPFGKDNVAVPVKALKRLIDNESPMSDEVRRNLVTVLKNLNKQSTSETDDLLRSLECSIGQMQI